MDLNNSQGILVLFRLEDKTWKIPGETKRGNSAALVAYLRRQTDVIKREYPRMMNVEVYGIDCVG